jgi:predicted PolB exonuclease-like 3'-5' exonuclease
MNNRWYDKHPQIGYKLDTFKEMDAKLKDHLIKGIMNLVKNYDPDLLSYEKAFDFPLSLKRHRWYDQDPYLWLMFNTLMMADDVLLQSIADYFEKELPDR